ncbi:MAG: DUF1217 domain-containing protein [Hyphomicrobiales bacterium]|nr:DUF1217 domain-containing protein [Hyphomicrobiales bacterium]
MSTTTATYQSIAQNLSRYQNAVGNQPTVKTATKYYEDNIGSVTSISQFVNNYRLLSYALDAYGLGDQVHNKSLVKQVLEQGVTNPRALANTLSNPNWAKFAAAFNFVGSGAASISKSSAVHTTTADYVEEQLETQEGKQDPGVQLALYFQRVAPTIHSALSIMGDTNLLDVVQTALDLPPETGATNIHAEAAEINRLMPMSELHDPKELSKLTERFTATYDLDYGPGGTRASAPLIVNSDGASKSTGNAAASILSGVIGGNSSFGGSSMGSSLNSALLASVQNLSLGG